MSWRSVVVVVEDDGSVSLSFGSPGREDWLGQLPPGEADRLLRAIRRATKHCFREGVVVKALPGVPWSKPMVFRDGEWCELLVAKAP